MLGMLACKDIYQNQPLAAFMFDGRHWCLRFVRHRRRVVMRLRSSQKACCDAIALVTEGVL
jgi:hypothetical protein